MTATTIRVQMAQRKDTAANWTAANPILLSGEIGYETDTEKFKIGDGTTNWNSLAYLPIPDGSGNLTITGNLEIGTTGTLTFEGSTADDFETTLAVTDPTADRTITLPDVSGTVVTTGDTGSVTSTMIADGTIVNADVSATAEIAVSKLANGTANQVLVTDGTDVSWSDDLTLAGNLTVNGTTTTVNTETLVVEDKNIELGVVGTPTDLTADGGGITLKGTTDKTINWVDATDAWTSSERFSVPLGSNTAPSLTFTGDENTGIYSPGADQVAVATNGVGRLFVDANGQVGVGGSPAQELHVYGATDSTLRLQSTSDNRELNISCGHTGFDADQIIGQSASLRLLANGFENLRLGGSSIIGYTSGSERMRITSAGLVGIGTSSPSQKLSIGNGSMFIQNSSSAAVSDLGITFALDANTQGRVYSPSGKSFAIQAGTAGSLTDALTIDQSGRVGIGTNVPSAYDSSANTLVVRDASNSNSGITIASGGGNTGNIYFADSLIGDAARRGIVSYDHSSNSLALGANASEAMRIDSSGRLLIGTFSSVPIGSPTNAKIQQLNTSATPNLALANFVNANAGGFLILGASRGASIGSYTAVVNNDRIGSIRFAAADGTDLQSLAGSIECYAEANAASDDTPGRLVFSTTADGASSPTERMRITKAGTVTFSNNGTLDPIGTSKSGGFAAGGSNNPIAYYVSDNVALKVGRGSNGNLCQFFRNQPSATEVGTISVTTTATSYNTSSDYRLKENVTPVTDGITRLQQLKPSRFNFIADPDKTVDGFLAHEVQAIVPEAITGEKDAVDDEGNAQYQGIDQSKLVPLLTAALQEAIAKIETLEQRLNDAGIN